MQQLVNYTTNESSLDELQYQLEAREIRTDSVSKLLNLSIVVSGLAAIFLTAFTITLCLNTIFSSDISQFVYKGSELIAICAMFATFTSLLMLIASFLLQTRQNVSSDITNYRQYIDFLIERRKREYVDAKDAISSDLQYLDRYWNASWKKTPQYSASKECDKKIVSEHLLDLLEKPFTKKEFSNPKEELRHILDGLPSSHKNTVHFLNRILSTAYDKDNQWKSENKLQRLVLTTFTSEEKAISLFGALVFDEEVFKGVYNLNLDFFEDLPSGSLNKIFKSIGRES